VRSRACFPFSPPPPGRSCRSPASARTSEHAYPSGRYWYLEAIGVDKGRQDAGIGTRLLEPTLAVADRDGIPCYLETVSGRNVTWYQRLGFRVHREGLEFITGGPTYWTMIRPPRSSCSSLQSAAVGSLAGSRGSDTN
jgi:GNAT superfamily N-acetyltransferase